MDSKYLIEKLYWWYEKSGDNSLLLLTFQWERAANYHPSAVFLLLVNHFAVGNLLF